MPQDEILQATAHYPPASVGGTEVYVEGLVGELGRLGIRSTVLMPRHASQVASSPGVESYPVNDAPTAEEFAGKPHSGFGDFVELLRRHRGAIYHQHTWTRGCGPYHLRAARELGLRTVLTVHVPGNTCLRGTMLRYGRGPCSGKVDTAVCGSCWAMARGVPAPAARLLGHLPLSFARTMRNASGRVATALAARAVAEQRLNSIADMIANADRIVAVCQWLYDVLADNGAPRAKLTLCRQGVAHVASPCEEHLDDQEMLPRRKLRLVFLGRLDPVKGIDTAIEAVRRLPSSVDVQFDIFAAVSAGHEAYAAIVRKMAGGDPRIAFHPPIERDGVAGVLRSSDALLVPSTWFETGPLVVLEAQAQGLFVIGSRRGGIAELVRDGEDGELVIPGDAAAWSDAIMRLAARRAVGHVPPRRRNIRTMRQVAADMAALYGSLY